MTRTRIGQDGGRRWRRRVRVLALTTALMTAVPAVAQAATVTSTADSGPGSLRDAINNSASGETIDFSLGPGAHTITLTTGALVVPHALTISGPGGSSLTIDGNQQSGVFDIEAGNTATVAISGLTITHGAVSSSGATGGGGIFDNTASQLTLSGVSITGNKATITSASSGGGGGVFVNGGAVTVTNSTISGNQVSLTGAVRGDNGGGGLFNAGGAISLTNTAVNGNTVHQTASGATTGSDGGGGIYSDGGDLKITGGSVNDNSDDVDTGQGSDGGGGIFDSGGNITLTGTTVNGNSFTVGTATGGDNGAGGILSEGGDLAISSSSIDANSFNVTDTSTSGISGDNGGGGLLNEGGAINLTGSSISQNTGTVTAAVGGTNGNGGGAILDEGAHATYLNSTLSDNSVTVNGGGPPNGGGAIYALGGGAATDLTIAGNSINQPGSAIFSRFGTFRFRNTIVAGSCAGANGGTFASDGFNLETGNTCGLTAATDHPSTDPQLGPLQTNGGSTRTQALAPGSPAVDAGACTDAGGNPVSVDQRGVARPQPSGGKCDIGAYELVPASTPPPPPAARTTTPSSTSSTKATLSGVVNPEGQPTTYFFQYGIDPSLRPPGAASALYDHRTASGSLPGDTSSHGVATGISGLVPNALYHVRVVASNPTGTTFGPDVTFTTRRDPAPPPPVLGRSENAKPVSGHVFLLIAGRLVPLTEARKLPSGTTVDARRGSLELTAATKKPRKRETGVFGGAVFALTQSRAGLSTLTLREDAFKGAPSYASCRGRASDGHAALSSRVLQTLRSSARGHFRTRGRFAAGTVRGTRWTTSDRCDGTRIAVQQHSVLVTDFVKRITVLVKAGHSYLARARK